MRANLPDGVAAPTGVARNGADGHHVNVAGDESDLNRLQRHAGGGNTVANAVASAQAVGYNKAGQRLPHVPGAHPPGAARRPQPPNQPPPYPPHHRQRVGADETGGAQGRLPAVPGARPPPTPSSVYSQQQNARVAVPRYADPTPSREIRMVYHKANGDSRVSIFARDGTRGQHYYNPITHQAMEAAAGSKYHSRKQPTQSEAYPQPSSFAAQQYSAQRARVTPSHWY